MSLTKNFKLLKTIIAPARNLTQVRNSGHGTWSYRKLDAEYSPKINFHLRDALIAFTTWWVLWHIYHEPGHLFGEYEYPDPSKWTNAELGIPPDDE